MPAPAAPTDKPKATSIEQKLDAIVMHLERLDRRDRLRTWGGFLRGVMALVPLFLLLWSTWYFIQHSDELMSKIITQTTKATAEYAQPSGQGMLDQMMKQYALPPKK